MKDPVSNMAAQQADLAKRAIGKDAEAQLTLGVWRITGHAGEPDIKEGLDWLRRAYASDVAIIRGRAAMLLATAHAMGFQDPQTRCSDFTTALDWLCRAADLGQAAAYRQFAQLCSGSASSEQVLRLWQEAALAGDAVSAYRIGLHHRRSKDEGIRLVGTGFLVSAARAQHPLALQYLKENSLTQMKDPVAIYDTPLDFAALSEQVRWPHLSKPESANMVDDRIDLKVWTHDLDPDLRDYVIGLGSAWLERATVNDTGAMEIHDDSRTNAFANFNLVESDCVVASVDRLMQETVGAKPGRHDPLSLLCYQPGQRYAPHYDFFDPASPVHAQAIKSGGNRERTVLLYLNDDYEGGATSFPSLGQDHKGQAGQILQFRNLKPDQSPNPDTLHEGAPVKSGTKWLLSKWLRTEVEAKTSG